MINLVSVFNCVMWKDLDRHQSICGPLGVYLLSCSGESRYSKAKSTPFPTIYIAHHLKLLDSYVDQLNQILQILGTPSDETMERIGSPKARFRKISSPQPLTNSTRLGEDLYQCFSQQGTYSMAESLSSGRCSRCVIHVPHDNTF